MQKINKEKLDEIRHRYRQGFLAKNSPLINMLNELEIGEGVVTSSDEIPLTSKQRGAGHINRFFKRYGSDKRFSMRQLRGMNQIVYERIK